MQERMNIKNLEDLVELVKESSSDASSLNSGSQSQVEILKSDQGQQIDMQASFVIRERSHDITSS